MSILNKEQILQRGWSEDSFTLFTNNKPQVVKNFENFWHLNFVNKVEKSTKFKIYTHRGDFTNREQPIVPGFENPAIMGIKLVNELKIDFNQGNHLLAQKENYDVLKPIFHLVKTDFEPDENRSYSVFTDGSFKTLNNQAFASCGGWIMDNKTQEVIIEFSMPVQLNESKKRSMPKFELIGIYEASKLVKQLKLKNVQFYTDEAQEAKRVLLRVYDDKLIDADENKDLYESIANIFKSSNSSISWIPREYNSHADEISEIPLNEWIKNNEGDYKHKDYIAENGYKIDRETAIYFHQQLKNNLTLIVTNHTAGKNQSIVSLIHDRKNNRFNILESIPKDFSYIDQSVPEEIKRIKKLKLDSVLLINLAKAINMAKDYGDINICVPPLVMAVENKTISIPKELQEEFFAFHKALHEYPGNITMTHKWPSLDEKMKDYLRPMQINFVNQPEFKNTLKFK
jgi:ribonuclease HI